jgi:Ca-activated chloride channel homolog
VVLAAQQLGARAIRVFPILPTTTPFSLQLSSLEAPLEVREGERVDARLALSSTAEGEATLEVRSDGTLLATERFALTTGEGTFAFHFQAPPAGVQVLSYAVRRADGSADPWPEDDRIEAWIWSRSRDATLVTGIHAEAIATTLVAEGRRARVAPWPPPLAPGGTVVVSGPDLGTWSAADGQRFARWVSHEGGTLLLAGGPAGLGTAVPWWKDFERTLPVRFPDDKKPAPAPVALVYVVDRSDSMVRMKKMELATAAILQSLEGLHPSSLVGVLGFSDFPTWVVPLMPASNRDVIGSAVEAITLQGGTDIYPAVRAAGQALLGTEALTKHAILLTDGQGLSRLQQNTSTVDALARAGITVSTVALSGEAAVDELAELARLTGGRAYRVHEGGELPKILVDETMLLVQKNAREEPTLVTCVPTNALCEGIPWAEAPPLTGYNQAEARTTADLALVIQGGRPLLASWHYGLGATAVFNSELGGGWTEAWTTWPLRGPWLSRLLDELERRPKRHDVALDLRPTPEGVAVEVRVLDPVGLPRGGLALVARARTQAGDAEWLLRERAPGLYGTRVPWDGAVLVAVDVPESEGRAAVTVQGQASPPPPIELRRPLLDPELAGRVAAVTGGTVDPNRAELLEDVRTKTIRRSLAGLAFLVGLLGLVVDVGIRRLPLGG